jgi:Histone acetylation protein/Bromodomain
MAPCSSDPAQPGGVIDVEVGPHPPTSQATALPTSRSRLVVGFKLSPSPQLQRDENEAIMTFTTDTSCATCTKDPTDEPDQKRRRLSRLVSQDEMARESRRGEVDADAPACPNPLQDAGILRNHITALRLEKDLHPLRLLVSRLMSNQTHNRKGIFNEPVDPVALGLPDYTSIVKRPMDLGTVKRRLYAVAYPSRQEAADDIRRVFTNAMLYNPPMNIIHKCAAELLAYFNACYDELDSSVMTTAPIPTSVSDKTQTDVGAPRNGTTPTADAGVVSASSSRSNDVDVSVLPRTEDTVAPLATAVPGTTSTTEGEAQRTSSKARKGITRIELLDVPRIQRKRRPSISSSACQSHFCTDCQGRTCTLCNQGCLQHEPSLLVCCGPHCAGSKIRKGALYFITPDGTLQFCERCHSSLPSALSEGTSHGTIRYKQELLKRRNDEEIAEQWISCRSCTAGVHKICAMHNSFVHDPTEYLCPECVGTDLSSSSDNSAETTPTPISPSALVYTFVSGREEPIPISQLTENEHINNSLHSDMLPECPISKFIQEKVQNLMAGVTPNAEKTITIRVISDCDRQFDVPEVIRRYFRMETSSMEDDDECIKPPSSVSYRQKAIAMFQKLDGVDVCIFCMFVQEYAGYEDLVAKGVRSDKRVYIAYIDSLSHFRPREIRTEVFHEILISYLATARERGFEKANIWSCPPSRGNCFVFWNHPASQRTPTADRLQAWYHTALATAVRYGVVTDVKSMYETDFDKQLAAISHEDTSITIGSAANGKMVCPPLIDGDFWVEEVSRIHSANIAKQLKVRTPTDVCVWNVTSLNDVGLDRCPALQVAAVIKDRVMTHPVSVPFRRPVNAAAMKLKNYHTIIKKPMDLGTIYSRCVLGQYERLRDVVADVELMTSNAKIFNPVGHIVHKYAIDTEEVFYSELNVLVQVWEQGDSSDSLTWQSFENMSMNLDVEIEIPETSTPEKLQTSVVVEDDLSTDASKSLSSSVAASMADTASHQEQEQDAKTRPQDSSTSPPNGTSSDPLASGTSKRRPGRPKIEKPPEETLDILTGDPKAIQQRMVGEDLWLLEKNTQTPTSSSNSRRKKDGKRRRRLSVGDDDSSSGCSQKGGRRRQSWLCEELTETVRRMRRSFFSCSLVPSEDMTVTEQEKVMSYKEYSSSFCPVEPASEHNKSVVSSLADARSAVLELCQFRHLEFDTLRRAKYSTSMLLYHLHHSNAPGATPICTSCGIYVADVRWHKVEKIEDLSRVTNSKRKRSSLPQPTPDLSTTPKPTSAASPKIQREELCTECYRTSSCLDDFIPISLSSYPSTGHSTNV